MSESVSADSGRKSGKSGKGAVGLGSGAATGPDGDGRLGRTLLAAAALAAVVGAAGGVVGVDHRVLKETFCVNKMVGKPKTIKWTCCGGLVVNKIWVSLVYSWLFCLYYPWVKLRRTGNCVLLLSAQG